MSCQFNEDLSYASRVDMQDQGSENSETIKQNY